MAWGFHCSIVGRNSVGTVSWAVSSYRTGGHHSGCEAQIGKTIQIRRLDTRVIKLVVYCAPVLPWYRVSQTGLRW